MTTSRTLALACVACASAFANPATALDVVLTNDDGWSAVGIQVLKDALEAAGHHVILAAPLTDQSGSSMAIDMEPVAVKKQAENEYSVALWRDSTLSAKPATSGLVGIGIAQESGHSPDLLISGINTSANVGMISLLSGTVGAANHAVTSVLNGPVPAIAVGTDEPACDPACKLAHYGAVADYIVRFVGYLETKPGFLASESGLLPGGVGLIISYPSTDAIKGTRIAVQSNGILVNGVKMSGGYACASTGCAGLAVNQTQRARMVLAADASPDIALGDLGYYTQGYVTILPVTPDFTVRSPLQFKSVLSQFE
jgi:5'-nucleotidase